MLHVFLGIDLYNAFLLVLCFFDGLLDRTSLQLVCFKFPQGAADRFVCHDVAEKKWR